MARLSTLAAVLLALVALSSVEGLRRKRKGGGHKYSQWMDAHGTFYEASNAAGMAGGCGYGNVYVAGYGDQTAAASGAIWYGGQACGACYEVMCVSGKYCKAGARTVITVTNRCPYGSTGGWCDGNKVHLDMAVPAWRAIGTDTKAGWLSTKMRRVPCKRQGGIRFQISGNPWFLMVMISNVGGPGDLKKVEVRSANGNWMELKQNWGAVYSGSSPGNKEPLTFRLSSRTANRQTVCWNAAPKGWSIGSTYQADCQFRR